MPDLLVVNMHVKNPAFVHGSVALNLADQHKQTQTLLQCSKKATDI